MLEKIKRLEKGRQGFSPQELVKVKFWTDLDKVASIGIPFNPKLDSVPPSSSSTNDRSATFTEQSTPLIYGARSPDCPCCEMEVRNSQSFLYLRCCRTLYHQKCIEVWMMCQKFCPNKKCGEIIKVSQYFS